MSMKRAEYNWDGARLDELIARSGSSRKQVANIIGISDSILCNYVYNTTKPDIDSLIKLANFFAVPLDYLCGRCDEETAHRILYNYGETYEAIRIKDYEDCLYKKVPCKLIIPNGYYAPWPYNLLEDIFQKTFSEVLDDDRKKGLDEALKTLTPREQKAIENHYELGLTLDETGKELNVQRERVRQIAANGIRKLRHPARRAMILNGYEGNKLINEYKKKLKDIERRESLVDKRINEFIEAHKKDGVNAEMFHDEKTADVISDRDTPRPWNGSGWLGPSEAFMELDLSVRSYNALVRANVKTVKEVTHLIENGQIKKIRNLGNKSIYEIRQRVSEAVGYDVKLPETA